LAYSAQARPAGLVAKLEDTFTRVGARMKETLGTESMSTSYTLPLFQASPTQTVLRKTATGGIACESAPRPAPSGKQFHDVQTLMSDRQWRSLSEISDATGHPPASVSARLRQLRGRGLTVHRRRRLIGGCPSRLWEYRLVLHV
jgi:biotin operon repressor